MTDEAPHVNRPFSLRNAEATLRPDLVSPGQRIIGWTSLANVLASPTEQRIELVRVDHEVNDKGDGGQHKYEVSHGYFPR